MTDKLFVTDDELAARLGMPADKAMVVIRMLERKGGFPPKIELCGGRRYWPAVKDFFDRLYGSMRNDAPRVAPEHRLRERLARRSPLGANSERQQ